MGYKEKEIINKVLLEGRKKGRLFRVNAGMAWAGEIRASIIDGEPQRILKNPRPFHGMPAGTADVIGWERKEIATPCCGSCKYCKFCDGLDYLDCTNKKNNLKNTLIDIDTLACKNYEPRIPKKIAVFKAVEVKTGKQKLSEKQENFKRQLLKDGGIYEERRD